MENLQQLLQANQSWQNTIHSKDPKYFTKLAAGQQPKILWFGCADSRTSPEIITATELGNFFVHRNVGNIIYQNDNSMHAVLDYGVRFLNIKQIVICGHTQCGAVGAVLQGDKLDGAIKTWLGDIYTVHATYQARLAKFSQHEQYDKLVRLNVLEQLKHLLNIKLVQDFLNSNDLVVTGAVFNLATGLVENLVECSKEHINSSLIDSAINELLK